MSEILWSPAEQRKRCGEVAKLVTECLKKKIFCYGWLGEIVKRYFFKGKTVLRCRISSKRHTGCRPEGECYYSDGRV